jgi:hypothetical protein
MTVPFNLHELPPFVPLALAQQVLDVSEHNLKRLRSEGRLNTVLIGGRKLIPRWQLFELAGLTDPDVAVAQSAAEAAAQVVVTNAETAPIPLSAVPASQVGSLKEVTRVER